jgi:hypothetical protein
MHSLRRLGPVFVVALGAAIPAALGAQAPAAGSASAPLTVRATCDATTMRVQLANTSNKATPVVVGFNADNGKVHVVNSVSTFAIRLATGAEEEYFYVNGKYALAKGPAWVVSLAPGATHEMQLPLAEFISTLNYSALDSAVAGGTRFVFTAREAGKATPAWTGKIETRVEPCTP